jgi:hypothetical protein
LLSNHGVAGFFEDIPALIVVIIGFGIFLLSMVNAFVAYQSQQNSFRMHQESVEFSQAIRGYDRLTYNSMEGVFLGDNILNLSDIKIKNDFHPNSLNFNYLVIIKDVSDYPDSHKYIRNFDTSDVPQRTSIYTVSSSVVIVVGDNYHAAQLIVMIWE